MQLLKTINRKQLKQWMDEGHEFILIDVLPEEFYRAVHLPGAVNACVYYVDFVTQVKKFAPEKSSDIVVYCNSSTSKAAEFAAQKLMEIGYTEVYHYAGGTVDWRRASHPVEGEDPDRLVEPQLANKIYQINPDQSIIEWIGRGIANSHRGTINLTEGSFQIVRGGPVRAEFKADMRSIVNLDIKDATWNQILIAHLKSPDFFDVENFPTAQFEMHTLKPIVGAKTGGATHVFVGRLTIKGVTREIDFPATVNLRDDGAVAAEAHFDIDRTEWNIVYGSGKFFEKLGRHLVYDLITLQISIVAI